MTRFTLHTLSLPPRWLGLLIKIFRCIENNCTICYAIIYSTMKHSTTTLLFLCAPCVVVSSFTNTRGIIHVSTRRQPSMPRHKDSLAPLLLHLQQTHDKDKSMKFDDPITGAAEESSLYMPYDLLPPPVSQQHVLELTETSYSLAHIFSFDAQDNWVANSTRRLSRIDLQKAITKVKRFVENRLETDLNLFEVSTCTWSLTLAYSCAYN